jgi:glucose/arabinose dehydrogenase
MRSNLLLLLLALLVPGFARAAQSDAPLPQVPAGFGITVYAEVPRARQLAVGPPGVIFVGSRGDRVYALIDGNDDGYAESVRVVAQGLDTPAGIAWRDGDLYVAEVTRITRWRGQGRDAPEVTVPEILLDSLPAQRGHAMRPLAFGPDGALYFAVGVPCNICLPASPHGEILRLVPGDSRAETWAKGVRNPVGTAWHPHTGELWFTDNGRDWLGDDLPSCELNRAPAPGLHFGYPYRHGLAVEDPEFGAALPSDLEPVGPELELGAHVAPLGLAFHSGTGWPVAYAGNLFIAEHGSWNRSHKSGYRVVRVELDASGTRVTRHTPFVTGWLQGESAWGRPVDVAVGPDGSLFVSDDEANRVYRVFWKGERAPQPGPSEEGVVTHE